MNPTYAEINLKNLEYNYNSIRRKSKNKIMAVVKADAYGHGMTECVKELSKLPNEPEYYGVALLNEAMELRNAKITNRPILCFAPFELKYSRVYLTNNISPSITSIKHVNYLMKVKLTKKLKVHININTGMNRIGISYNKAYSEIVRLSKKKDVVIDGVYTHFATSDERNKSFAKLQLSRFTALLQKLSANNINYGLAHAANSGAILDMPDSYFDMVRPGISLYGYYPSLETTQSIKLKPVMSVFSILSTSSIISKGESVGYGRKYIAKNKFNCGSIPIGYADGLQRNLSNKLRIIIKNKIYDQIGRVSMDRINVNLNDDNIRWGSKVIILGKSKDHNINAWDWSKILHTIPYEITCGISKRVPRKYVGKS